MEKKYNEGLCSQFFGYLYGFIHEAYSLNPKWKLCAEVTQDEWNLIEMLGAATSIHELPENLQKIAYQSIPYFLKTTSIYTEDDIPY